MKGVEGILPEEEIEDGWLAEGLELDDLAGGGTAEEDGFEVPKNNN